jgi:hypothetical protein
MPCRPWCTSPAGPHGPRGSRLGAHPRALEDAHKPLNAQKRGNAGSVHAWARDWFEVVPAGVEV